MLRIILLLGFLVFIGLALRELFRKKPMVEKITTLEDVQFEHELLRTDKEILKQGQENKALQDEKAQDDTSHKPSDSGDHA